MRARWFLLAALLLTLDVYLLAWRWADVAGNVEAQAIISTPQFIALHLATKRHVDRRHVETQARLDAQDAALNIPPPDQAAG